MNTATKLKPQALPRAGADPATDGTVLAQLAALQRLSVNELKVKWEGLFATAAPNNSRAFLGNCSPRALNALKRGFATDFLRG